MKKMIVIGASLMLVIAGNAFATGGNLQKSDSSAVSAPHRTTYETFGGPGAFGYSNTNAAGFALTYAHAEGDKKAFTTANTEGTVKSDSGAFVFQGNGVVAGGIGAYSVVKVEGSGLATGIDRRAYGPDTALVDIYLSGSAYQQTSGYVGTTTNGFGGQQESLANFSGWDSDYSVSSDFSLCWWNVNLPAIAIDKATGEAHALGGTIGFNAQTPNSALGGSLTTSISAWSTDAPKSSGYVFGNGDATFIATKIKGQSYGQVHGTASYMYEGANNGMGIAAVAGKTTITNVPNGVTVKSTSVGYATSTVEGSARPQ